MRRGARQRARRPATAAPRPASPRQSVAARLLPHVGIVRVEEKRELRRQQVLFVGDGGRLLHPVGVVEHDAEVTILPTHVSEQIVGWPASIRG